MKNKIIIGIAVIILLGLVALDKYDKHNFLSHRDDKIQHTEELVERTDSIVEMADSTITKLEDEKQQNLFITDSLQKLLDSNKTISKQERKKLEQQIYSYKQVNKDLETAIKEKEVLPRNVSYEFAPQYKDSVICRYHYKDSTILKVDTISVIQIDTIIIDDKDKVKKIKKKYLDN